ncbi:MAG: hypothetical protein V1904_12330 [Bacteroidota bacterium]
MKRFYLYMAVVITASVLYFSCESSVENNIDGTWRMINVGDLSPDKYTEWTLMDGYIHMIETYVDSTNLDTLNYGSYTIKIKRLTRYLRLSENSKSQWDGDWKIDKLNSKYLVLVRDQDYLEYYEFVKK